jgi:hypothetical protein
MPRSGDHAQMPIKKALQRLSTATLEAALQHAGKIDLLAKGIGRGNIWEEFLRLGLRLDRGSEIIRPPCYRRPCLHPRQPARPAPGFPRGRHIPDGRRATPAWVSPEPGIRPRNSSVTTTSFMSESTWRSPSQKLHVAQTLTSVGKINFSAILSSMLKPCYRCG